MLEDRDSYPPPNDAARASAAEATSRLRAAGLVPEDEEDDALGGLAIYVYGCIAKFAWFDCSNSGATGCVLSGVSCDGPKSWDVATAGWPETIARINAHFAECET